MSWWQATLWALMGVSLVEAYDLERQLRFRGVMPWREHGTKRHDPRLPSATVYGCACGLRLAIGGGIAAGAAESGMVANPWTAITFGIASLAVLERTLTQVRFKESELPSRQSQIADYSQSTNDREKIKDVQTDVSELELGSTRPIDQAFEEPIDEV